MTPNQIHTAMSLWRQNKQGPRPEPEVHSEGSEDSERTMVSFFDRIEKGLKHPIEDVHYLLSKKQLRERIQKEEKAKSKTTIKIRIHEEK